MRVASLRKTAKRAVTAGGVVLATVTVAAATLVNVGAAWAAPATVTGSTNYYTSTVTASNTTPEVGEVVSLSYKITATLAPDTAIFALAHTVKSVPDASAVFGTLVGPVACEPVSRTRFNPCGGPDSTSSVFTYESVHDDNLRNGDSAEWKLSFKVLPTDAGTSFTLHPGVGATTPFTFTVAPPPTANADVDVALSGQPRQLGIGYTLEVTNNGPDSLTRATITTRVPDSTASVSGLPSDCSYNSVLKIVSCSIAGLANQARTTKGFTVHFGLLTVGIPLRATAQRISSAPEDPDDANDSATKNCLAVTPLIILC